jgi:hypothetical protein
VECHECGADNPESSTYCGLCSHKFKDGTVAAGVPGVKDSKGPATDGTATPGPTTAPPEQHGGEPGSSFLAIDSPYYLSKIKAKKRRPIMDACGLGVLVLAGVVVIALIFGFHGNA